MARFKKGDKVRVRMDVTSLYRGRVGTIDQEPPKEAYWYMVRFESNGERTFFFTDRDLELLYSDKVLV